MITLQETLRGVFYAPFYAAMERGAFAAEGVEIGFVSSPTPAQALEALMAGTADVGWGGPMRVNHGNRTIPGADFVCFAEVVTRDPFFLVTRAPRAPYAPEQLQGLRFGKVTEVPTPWLCLQHDLRLAGLDPASVAVIDGRTMEQNSASLLAGELDVTQCFQPYAETLVEQGCHIWWSAADRGPCSYTTLYASRATLAAKTDELAAMVRALYATQRWLHASNGAAIADTVASYFPGQPRPRLAACFERYLRLGIWGRNPVLPRGGYERLRDSLVTGGLIDRGLSFEQAVDNTLAEAAIRQAADPGVPTRSPNP